jgi:hypothetical protein
MSPLQRHVSLIATTPLPQADPERMQWTNSSMWFPTITKYTSTLNPLAQLGQSISKSPAKVDVFPQIFSQISHRAPPGHG